MEASKELVNLHIDIDRNRGVSKKFGVRGIPAMFFLEPDGTQIQKWRSRKAGDIARRMRELAAEYGGMRARVSAQAQLVCGASDLELPLRARARVGLKDDVLKVLKPGQDRKPGDSWSVESARLKALAERILEVEWFASADRAEAYRKWFGSELQQSGFEIGGSVTATLSGTEEGRRIDFEGTLTVKRTGEKPGRSGAKGWQEESTHILFGSLHLDEKGELSGFELTDRFEASGAHFHETPEDEDAQPYFVTGAFEASTFPPTLNEIEKKRAMEWIDQLGKENYEIRERATNALIELGEAVAPLIEKHALEHEDPEVRARAKRILRAVKP